MNLIWVYLGGTLRSGRRTGDKLSVAKEKFGRSNIGYELFIYLSGSALFFRFLVTLALLLVLNAHTFFYVIEDTRNTSSF